MKPQIDSEFIPLLKFDIDPNELENLKLVKYAEIEPNEPEYLFLLENTKTDKFYCVWEKDMHTPLDTLSIVREFMGSEFSEIREIKPKRDDWYQTHWLFELS